MHETSTQAAQADARPTLWERLSDESGATAVEYGAMVALILAVIIGVVTVLGTQVQAAFQTVCTALNSGTAC